MHQKKGEKSSLAPMLCTCCMFSTRSREQYARGAQCCCRAVCIQIYREALSRFGIGNPRATSGCSPFTHCVEIIRLLVEASGSEAEDTDKRDRDGCGLAVHVTSQRGEARLAVCNLACARACTTTMPRGPACLPALFKARSTLDATRGIFIATYR